MLPISKSEKGVSKTQFSSAAPLFFALFKSFQFENDVFIVFEISLPSTTWLDQADPVFSSETWGIHLPLTKWLSTTSSYLFWSQLAYTQREASCWCRMSCFIYSRRFDYGWWVCMDGVLLIEISFPKLLLAGHLVKQWMNDRQRLHGDSFAMLLFLPPVASASYGVYGVPVEIGFTRRFIPWSVSVARSRVMQTGCLWGPKPSPALPSWNCY